MFMPHVSIFILIAVSIGNGAIGDGTINRLLGPGWSGLLPTVTVIRMRLNCVGDVTEEPAWTVTCGTCCSRPERHRMAKEAKPCAAPRRSVK